MAKDTLSSVLPYIALGLVGYGAYVVYKDTQKALTPPDLGKTASDTINGIIGDVTGIVGGLWNGITGFEQGIFGGASPAPVVPPLSDSFSQAQIQQYQPAYDILLKNVKTVATPVSATLECNPNTQSCVNSTSTSGSSVQSAKTTSPTPLPSMGSTAGVGVQYSGNTVYKTPSGGTITLAKGASYTSGGVTYHG